VGSGGEQPLSVLWTWRQRLEQEQAEQADEKPQRPEKPKPRDDSARQSPADGPKQGDQGYLPQLQSCEEPFWTGRQLARDRRRDDVAVLTVGTDLPYPFRAGQRAIVECHDVPGVWRACWIGDPPAADHHIEIHVQAQPGDRATTALVHDAQVGDPIRLHRAKGDFVIERMTCTSAAAPSPSA
jgi:hypothetical protein